MKKSDLQNKDGIALMMVLWALTISMVLVFSFSLMTRTETHATLSFREGLEKKFLAEAGVERGIAEVFYRRQNINLQDAGIWKADGTAYTVQAVSGYYTVRITDEFGKVDINAASDIILRNLFANAGIPADMVDTIVDSIMDWKDPDDLHRLHGAESDYYMSLPKPYKAKDANFSVLEELLLVKGVTPEILYGSGGQKGLIDFLTVNLKSPLINISAAPKEVLMAVPGMTPETADNIISYRLVNEIRSLQDVQDILGQNYRLMAPHIIVGSMTNTYTIDAAGHKNNDKAGYSVRAVVFIESNNKYKYLYYKSPSHLRQ